MNTEMKKSFDKVSAIGLFVCKIELKLNPVWQWDNCAYGLHDVI
jgi:hypothetical protein